MRTLIILSMLIVGIAGGAICQKNKTGYDTLSVLEGPRPPILFNTFGKRSDVFFQEDISKNSNKITIDYGNKNRLLIDFKGTEFKLTMNVDSLLQSFWNDYQLLKESFRKDSAKKITYFGKNKSVNQKALIEVTYYPQKEVLQIERNKEVQLVRLKQDTLILINYANEAVSELVRSYNKVFKTYPHQQFTFALNSLDDIEDILETNINQAIIEASERVKNERKSTNPWKMIKVENDVLNQKIKSSISKNVLLDMLTFHADVGLGNHYNNLAPSFTFAVGLVSSNYYKKGFVAGIQYVFPMGKTESSSASRIPTIASPFIGMTFYQKKNNTNLLRGGIFVGKSYFNDAAINKGSSLKVFGWYQLTPLIRIQPEYDFSFKTPPSLRISFGI